KGEEDERSFWQSLARGFQQCLLGKTEEECRAEIEGEEWSPIATGTDVNQELHGVIAGGGSKFSSPARAPEGDLCISHDDIDWNFNVTPDAAYASLLQSGNATGDVDHPPGVIEAEWEGFFLDPA